MAGTRLLAGGMGLGIILSSTVLSSIATRFFGKRHDGPWWGGGRSCGETGPHSPCL
ncbi:MAG: hypothetical protein OXF02_01155 [Simkaniaceae bacterium]|nr:hypothetical protein [Simkaniaceae bacterium]